MSQNEWEYQGETIIPSPSRLLYKCPNCELFADMAMVPGSRRGDDIKVLCPHCKRTFTYSMGSAIQEMTHEAVALTRYRKQEQIFADEHDARIQARLLTHGLPPQPDDPPGYRLTEAQKLYLMRRTTNDWVPDILQATEDLDHE